MTLKLRELLTKILTAFTSSTETLTGSYNLQAIAYKRCGVVMLRIWQTTPTSLPKGSWTTVGTLSEKYRPINQVDAIIEDINTNDASKSPIPIRITTEGVIRVWAFSNGVTNNQVFSTVTYLARAL